MSKKGVTIREATRQWVEGMSHIPYGICEKLLELGGPEAIEEITPPSRNDRVYVHGLPEDTETTARYGTIINCLADADVYLVEMDDDVCIEVGSEDFEVQRDGYLPMWGTLWAFGDSIDNEWLRGEYLGNGLQAMADCGFRIYEQEDYEYIFGIDGAGYDFYESHWIPLYRARGLHWHDPETEKEAS